MNQLLEISHARLSGGHLRKYKTTQGLKYSFYWYKIKNYFNAFYETFLSSQLRAKPNKFDNVTIGPISRPEETM